MAFRTILIVLTGAESDLRVLDAAFDIARPIAARITALYADTDPDEIPAAYMADGMGVYITPELQQSLEIQFAERRRRQAFRRLEASEPDRRARHRRVGPDHPPAYRAWRHARAASGAWPAGRSDRHRTARERREHGAGGRNV